MRDWEFNIRNEYEIERNEIKMRDSNLVYGMSEKDMIFKIMTEIQNQTSRQQETNRLIDIQNNLLKDIIKYNEKQAQQINQLIEINKTLNAILNKLITIEDQTKPQEYRDTEEIKKKLQELNNLMQN